MGFGGRHHKLQEQVEIIQGGPGSAMEFAEESAPPTSSITCKKPDKSAAMSQAESQAALPDTSAAHCQGSSTICSIAALGVVACLLILVPEKPAGFGGSDAWVPWAALAFHGPARVATPPPAPAPAPAPALSSPEAPPPAKLLSLAPSLPTPPLPLGPSPSPFFPGAKPFGMTAFGDGPAAIELSAGYARAQHFAAFDLQPLVDSLPAYISPTRLGYMEALACTSAHVMAVHNFKVGAGVEWSVRRVRLYAVLVILTCCCRLAPILTSLPLATH